MKPAEIVSRLGMTESKYFEQDLMRKCNTFDNKDNCF